MVDQCLMSVNTGFYVVDFGHHIQNGCLLSRKFFVLSDAVQTIWWLAITAHEV